MDRRKRQRQGQRKLALFALTCALFAASPASANSCLPERRVDLGKFIAEQPLLPKSGGGKMIPVTRGSPRWMAAFNAILAWQNDDCQAFAAFAETLGYEAQELVDTVTNTHHWVMVEKGEARAKKWNGLFVLRAPGSQKGETLRRLVINAPHLGFDFSDDRAIKLYLKIGAMVLLQNAAHRCNLDTCSGCGSFPGYACGGAGPGGKSCVRASDAAHSVDHLLFAAFAALEATRTHDGAKPWLHFEYHGMATRPALGAQSSKMAACSGIAEISQGAKTALLATDRDSYPSHFWQALEKRMGKDCVCYHQRESGCILPGDYSVYGRLVNQESPTPFDPCTQESTRLSGRYIYFEWHNVPVETVSDALAEAVPKS